MKKKQHADSGLRNKLFILYIFYILFSEIIYGLNKELLLQKSFKIQTLQWWKACLSSLFISAWADCFMRSPMCLLVVIENTPTKGDFVIPTVWTQTKTCRSEVFQHQGLENTAKKSELFLFYPINWMFRMDHSFAMDTSNSLQRQQPIKRRRLLICALELHSSEHSAGELFISCSISGRMLLTETRLTVWVPPPSIRRRTAMWCLGGRFISLTSFKSFERACNTEAKKENIYCLWMWHHTGSTREQGGEVVVWGLGKNPASPRLSTGSCTLELFPSKNNEHIRVKAVRCKRQSNIPHDNYFFFFPFSLTFVMPTVFLYRYKNVQVNVFVSQCKD